MFLRGTDQLLSPLFSVYGALNSSCLCRGRAWGKLRASEAKRSGLALEQGSGLLFHKLISSQGCTAASQKSRQLISSPKGRRCRVPVCWVGTSTPRSPWPSRICQKYHGAETPGHPELPLFPQSHSACPPQSPWLFLPVFHAASVPVFLPAPLPGFLSLLCCSRQGAAALAVELLASVSLRRMQGPLGRGKQDQNLIPV